MDRTRALYMQQERLSIREVPRRDAEPLDEPMPVPSTLVHRLHRLQPVLMERLVEELGAWVLQPIEAAGGAPLVRSRKDGCTARCVIRFARRCHPPAALRQALRATPGRSAAQRACRYIERPPSTSRQRPLK